MDTNLRTKLMWINNLESNIKESFEIYQRNSSLLKEVQKNCKHEIVTIAGIISIGYSIEAKCLFCGEHFDIPHALRELPNENLLKAYNCNKFRNEFEGYFPEDRIYSYIENLANSIVRENPDITINELRDELQSFLSS